MNSPLAKASNKLWMEETGGKEVCPFLLQQPHANYYKNNDGVP